MSSSVPRRKVSIGLPVFNEARHIDAALRSLRALDYPDIEIIVCDNASTDETLALCRKHGAADARLRIESFPENRGVTANFRHVVDLATGDYFMWASGHDLWDPGLVSECVELLERNPDAVLAYASADWIDGDGNRLDRKSGWSDTRGQAPSARLMNVFWGNMHPVLGLMRLGKLRSCGPLPAIVGGDLVLLSALALEGEFLHAPRSSWSRRELRNETRYEQKVQRYASASFGVSRSRLDRTFPLMSLPLSLVRLVLRTKHLGLLDKLVVVAVLLPSFVLRYRVGRRANAR